MHKFQCRSCGEWHEGLPKSYASEAPAALYSIPPSERDARVELGSDQCVIDGAKFFVLSNIEIPILGSAERFVWSVWVSLSEANFERSAKLWTTAGRESEPPYFGWVSSSLPCYPDTLHLKAQVYTRPVGEKFLLQLEPTNHPLALEQRHGISPARVQEISEQVHHEAAAV